MAARALYLDLEHRVLLLKFFDPADPCRVFWMTPGGAVEAGESMPDAALRLRTIARAGGRDRQVDRDQRTAKKRQLDPVWRPSSLRHFQQAIRDMACGSNPRSRGAED